MFKWWVVQKWAGLRQAKPLPCQRHLQGPCARGISERGGKECCKWATMNPCWHFFVCFWRVICKNLCIERMVGRLKGRVFHIFRIGKCMLDWNAKFKNKQTNKQTNKRCCGVAQGAVAYTYTCMPQDEENRKNNWEIWWAMNLILIF